MDLDAVPFHDFTGDYLLVRHRAFTTPTNEWSLVDPRRAARIVTRVVGEDPGVRMRLLGYLARSGSRIRGAGRSVVENLVHGLTWGPAYELFVHARLPVVTGVIPPPSVVEPPPPPEPIVDTQWLRVILRDDRGEPIADVGFEVELDDGSVQTGRTNAAGEGYLLNLPPGRAKIRWPDLHPDDWAMV